MCTDQRGLDAFVFLTICYINVRYLLLLARSVLNSMCIYIYIKYAKRVSLLFLFFFFFPLFFDNGTRND